VFLTFSLSLLGRRLHFDGLQMVVLPMKV